MRHPYTGDRRGLAVMGGMATTRKITAGEGFAVDWYRRPSWMVAAPSCAGQPARQYAGRHYCATHPDAWVPNNMTFNSHLEDPGNHVEVWICNEHGPEVP